MQLKHFSRYDKYKNMVTAFWCMAYLFCLPTYWTTAANPICAKNTDEPSIKRQWPCFIYIFQKVWLLPVFCNGYSGTVQFFAGLTTSNIRGLSAMHVIGSYILSDISCFWHRPFLWHYRLNHKMDFFNFLFLVKIIQDNLQKRIWEPCRASEHK